MKKRFYETATCAKVEDGYAVQLDGCNIKTPAGTTLVMPTKALAEAVAMEWEMQGEDIDPKSMSLMPLAGTAIDRIPDIRENLIEGLLKYAETDLLCYMADDTQPELAKRQEKMWQPVLDWAADKLGARFVATHGIVAIEQSPKALEALRIVLQDFDNWVLASMSELVGITGSLVLGLALVKGHLTVEEALHIARVDEDHQIEQWGYDFEAIQRRDHITKDVKAAYQFYELLKT